jgi:uncharacterized membrane protein YsdA (DUF1294 family)
MFAFSTQLLVVALALHLGGMNLVSFVMFGLDKRFAERGTWRVPELTLLMIAAAGGSAGALLGQKYFRHKTRKQPFKGLLFGIVAVQVILVGIILATVLQIM